MSKLYILIICICFFSCAQAPSLEKIANESAEKYIKDYYVDSEVVISNIRTNTKFLSDSLCIIDVAYDAKVPNSDKIQTTVDYIYLLNSNVAYEGRRVDELDDITFPSKEEYENKRIGEIYEELTYEDAIYYLAVLLINQHGRQVNNHNISVNVPHPLGYWKLYAYEDGFGDMTPKKYVGVYGKGTVSLDANRNIDQTVYLFIRNDDIYFKFHVNDLEYVCFMDLPILMKIKDSDGTVFSFDFICKQDGNICLETGNGRKQQYNQLLSIIKKGGVISGTTEINHSCYRFKIDVTGYQNALKRL